METCDLEISTVIFNRMLQLAAEQQLTIDQLISRLLEDDHGD